MVQYCAMVERRSCSPWMATFLTAVVCLSVWQIIGCPGPPEQLYVTTPVYTLLSPFNMSTEMVFTVDTLPNWDFSTLINLDNFKFEILNHVCNDSVPILLVLVHSAPNNTAKRRTIRETWGAVRENVKLLFMLGIVDTIEKQDSIDDENRIHSDIIQGSFKDAYRNMTYKHVMAFKYAVYYCPQAKYIMKTDDDVFVNMPTLMAFLNIELSPWGARRLLLCAPFYNPVVKRSYRSKWRVSFKEYHHKYYPTYCAGWAIIYSPDVVFRLYREAQVSEYFWIDDVHITGVLAQRTDIVHTPLRDLALTEEQVSELLNSNSTDSVPEVFLYGSPDLKPDVIYKLWLVVRNRLKNYHVTRSR